MNATDAEIEKTLYRERIEIRFPSITERTGGDFWSGSSNSTLNVLGNYVEHPNSGKVVCSTYKRKEKKVGYSLTELDYSRYNLLRDDYLREVSKYGHYIKCEPDKADQKVIEFINYISKINFTKAAIELTPSSSIKFSLLLNKSNSNLMLIITRPLHSLEDLNDDTVIFSIFKQETLLLSNAIPINSLVEGINSYLLQ